MRWFFAMASGLGGAALLSWGAIAAASSEPAAAPDGAALYAAQCAGCHGEYLQGAQFGPSLRGAGFGATWALRRDALFDYVRKTMPPNAGGSQPDRDYAAIVEHMFAVNTAAVEAMGAELTVGPQPLDEDAFQDEAYAQVKAQQEALLAGLSPVTPEMLRSPLEGDWLNWRRTPDGAGFSPLEQIDRSNVSGLRLKWAWSVRHGRNEIAPIVHDGVMFINSGAMVEALDARTGTLLWRYVRDIAPEHRGPLNMVQRNIAISGRMLLVPTPDRHLVALDMANGEVVWDAEIVDDAIPRAVLSAGPVVAGDIIVQGTSISALTPGGSFVVGLDAASGEQLWKFNNVAQPGSPGGTSWNGAEALDRTGGAVWVAPSYDSETGLVLYGTGGSYDMSKLLAPSPKGHTSDALYTNSTIALDPKTGEMKWHHQHMPREVWDLDEAFERTLADVRDRKLSVTIGKMGILDALDRETGEYAYSIDLGLNNIVTSIDPKTGQRTLDLAKVPKPNQPVEICPSVQGARNWMATAWNAGTHTLYLPLENLCMDYVWSDPGGTFDSTVDNGWKIKAAPGSDGLHGELRAIDLATRKVRWSKRRRTVPSSSLLATAGGLLFAGHTDRTFEALNDATGKVLWQTRLASAPNATPVTFTAGGKQYVAISSGAGGDQASQTEKATPEDPPSSPATTIFVFGL